MIPIIAMFAMICLANIFQKRLDYHAMVANSKKKYIIAILLHCIVLLPLYVFYAFQYFNSNDYYNYSVMFSEITMGIRSIKEPIIYWLFRLIGDADLKFQFVYLFIYLFVFVVLFKTLRKYSSDYILSFIMATCIFLGLMLFQIRQLLATTICFAAYPYIEEKKSIKFIILVLIASMCHMSALIMLPGYILFRYRYRISDIILLSAACFIAKIGASRLLPLIIRKLAPSRLNWYMAYKDYKIQKWELILLTIFIFIIIIYGKRVSQKAINRIYINAFMIYSIMFLFCRWIPEVKRWGYYYFFPIIALIPNCLQEEKNKNAKLLYSFLLLIYLLIYLILMYQKQLDLYSLRLLFWK